MSRIESSAKSTWANHWHTRGMGLFLLLIIIGIPFEASFVLDVHAESKQEPTIEFNIAPQALGSALNAFAVASGWQISASSEDTAGQTSPGLIGPYSREEGLRTLLAGSGLTYQLDGPRMITVKRATVDTTVPNERSSNTNPFPKPTKQNEGPVTIQAKPIIVEGQKVRRTLQEVPASVRVLDGEKAEGRRTREARLAIQGIPNVVSENGSNAPSIRGLDGSIRATGGGAVTTGAVTRVPTLVDGVPLPPTVATNSSLTTLWDVNTIEVARGPQSTSGGRNSIGGAVRIQTNDPIYDFEGAARFNYFNQDGTFGGALMLNAPIIEDQVAVRFASEVSDGESFIDFTDPTVASARDALENEELQRYRGKIAIEPKAIPGLKTLFSVDYSRSIEQFVRGIEDATLGDLKVTDVSTASDGITDNIRTIYQFDGSYELSNQFDIGARVSYLDNDAFFSDPATGQLALPQETKSISSEVLLRARNVGIVSNAVLGVAFENREDKGSNTTPFFPVVFKADNTNVGIFGEADFDLGKVGLSNFGLPKGLTLTLGGRIEIDDRFRDVAIFGIPLQKTIKKTAIIPKAGLRYDVSDDVTVGYLYSRGFKPGGVDFNFFFGPPVAVPFKAETLDNHEIYTRSAFFDRRLQVNLSLFYYIIHDPQIRGFGGATGGLFGNGERAIGYGGELELAYEFLDGLRVTGGLGLLDTELTDPGPANAAQKGKELERAPNITANAGLSYVSPFGFDASITMRFVGASRPAYFEPELDDYTVWDLAAGYEFLFSGDRRFRVDGFIKNLANDIYLTEDFPTTGTRRAVGRPRTFGITGTLRF